MIIQCENCSKKFIVKDRDIPEEGRSVQCGHCSFTWYQKSISVPNEPIKLTKIVEPSKKINESLLYGYQVFLDLFKKNQAEVDPIGGNKHALSIESTPLIYNEDLISIELSVYENLGGAHPNTYKTGLIHSIKDDLWIMPSDLADTESGLKEILDIFSNEAYQHISFNYPGTDPDEEWLKEGTQPTTLNFFDFTLTPEGIRLYIPTYQVAPYAVGAFEVPVEYSQVKEWITNQTILHYISKLEQ